MAIPAATLAANTGTKCLGRIDGINKWGLIGVARGTGCDISRCDDRPASLDAHRLLLRRHASERSPAGGAQR